MTWLNVVKRSALLLPVLVACCIDTAGAIAADAPLERAPDIMQARVLGCTACHGAHGEGTGNDYFPRLSSKPAGYLYNQLLAFRDGRRKYPPMNYLLAYLPDAYLKQIADYFAAERPPFPPPSPVKADAKTLDFGKTLVTKGDASRKIPACVSCHGASMTGMELGIPGLLGLHADYLSAQLGAWRYGTRSTITPDCMAQVSKLLSERDITAIAAYLASLPTPRRLPPARSRCRSRAAASTTDEDPTRAPLTPFLSVDRRGLRQRRALPSDKTPRRSNAANISPAQAIASRAIRCPRAKPSAAAGRWTCPSARSLRRTFHRTRRRASAHGPPTSATR